MSLLDLKLLPEASTMSYHERSIYHAVFNILPYGTRHAKKWFCAKKRVLAIKFSFSKTG